MVTSAFVKERRCTQGIAVGATHRAHSELTVHLPPEFTLGGFITLIV